MRLEFFKHITKYIFYRLIKLSFNETFGRKEVDILGYEIIRRDRITSGGGGVCFYVKLSVHFTLRSDLNVETLENLSRNLKT